MPTTKQKHEIRKIYKTVLLITFRFAFHFFNFAPNTFRLNAKEESTLKYVLMRPYFQNKTIELSIVLFFYHLLVCFCLIYLKANKWIEDPLLFHPVFLVVAYVFSVYVFH